MRIVIHIGLHKTASTYLQQHIFPRIDRRKVIYNPDDIFYFINSIFTLDLKDENRIQKANETVLPYRDLDTRHCSYQAKRFRSFLSYRIMRRI
jgi:hypothetical protein